MQFYVLDTPVGISLGFGCIKTVHLESKLKKFYLGFLSFLETKTCGVC